MELRIAGKARIVGDDVNTDYIISSSRKKETPDAEQLKKYLFETIDPSFAASVQPDDLLVAGKNFGCGSAMEIAVSVLLAAGFKAVLARSFARTFYRNAINNGLVPVECDTRAIQEGDHLILSLDEQAIKVTNETRNLNLVSSPFPPIILNLVSAGGLVPYFKIHHNFVI
jgi:3-isopropylmalate/(R)-2-methylmalate dehydratase small subunit